MLVTKPMWPFIRSTCGASWRRLLAEVHSYSCVLEMKKDARLQCGPTRATSTGKPGLCWRRILLQCLSRSAPAAEAAAQAAEVDGRAEEEAQEAGVRVEAARVEPVARAGKAELEARAELVAQAGQAARVELEGQEGQAARVEPEARAELPDAAAVETRI